MTLNRRFSQTRLFDTRFDCPHVTRISTHFHLIELQNQRYGYQTFVVSLPVVKESLI